MDLLRYEFWAYGNPQPLLKLREREEEFEMYIFRGNIAQSMNISIVFLGMIAYSGYSGRSF